MLGHINALRIDTRGRCEPRLVELGRLLCIVASLLLFIVVLLAFALV